MRATTIQRFVLYAAVAPFALLTLVFCLIHAIAMCELLFRPS